MLFRIILCMALLMSFVTVGCQPILPVEPADAGPAPEADKPTLPVQTGPIKVLCLGDLDIENNWGICAHLAGMAAATDPPEMVTADHIVKDWGIWESADELWELESALKAFWEKEEIKDKLVAGEWDWVVLYENLPDEAIAAYSSHADYEEIEQDYLDYGRKLADAIEQSGGSTVLLVPWDHPTQTSSNVPDLPSQDDLVALGQLVTDESNARLAPVGPAWKRSTKTYPELNLYLEVDRFSPTIMGTYLSAAVTYATILGRSPVGLDYQPADILPDSGPAAFFRDKWEMTDEECDILQQVASETVQEYYSFE